jgi:hypothetical protein
MDDTPEELRRQLRALRGDPETPEPAVRVPEEATGAIPFEEGTLVVGTDPASTLSWHTITGTTATDFKTGLSALVPVAGGSEAEPKMGDVRFNWRTDELEFFDAPCNQWRAISGAGG